MVLALAGGSSAALAAADDLQQGISLYNSGQFGQALPLLEKAARQSPYDATRHYYLGLCYQAQKQSTLAKAQFQWVAANAPDPTLKSYAAKALNASSQAHTAGSGASQSSQAVATVAPTSAVAQSPAVAAKPRGKCKAMMFETSWCHYCHEFAPHFDEVADKNRGKMDFQRLDAEDPSNAGLKEKYNVHSYPRLVYIDGSGNLIANEGRGGFDQRIAELTAP
ncbi:MAG: hypothetical protein KGS72_07035 [Cyanobacteria bacterium REEB67]|nr:hypothetical protein [Cyanobacteria bacterium REEB67]